jgi:predicted DNA-binding WGR domain protein
MVRAGQVRIVSYATAADAHEALAQQQRTKERRGYAGR